MKKLFEKLSSMLTDVKSKLWSANKFVFTFINVVTTVVFLATWSIISLKAHACAEVPAGLLATLTMIYGVSTTSKIMHKREETTQAKDAQDCDNTTDLIQKSTT